jgi:hypothetical protein
LIGEVGPVAIVVVVGSTSTYVVVEMSVAAVVVVVLSRLVLGAATVVVEASVVRVVCTAEPEHAAAIRARQVTSRRWRVMDGGG